MQASLFMFLIEAVAGTECQYRSGARHALLVFVRGDDLDESRRPALDCVEKQGWQFVEVKRAKEVSTDTAEIADETLRAAATHALEAGNSIIVYQDEIPNNA